MTEKPKQNNMSYGVNNIYAEKLHEEGDKSRELSMSSKSDTFVVDMERFAHILEKDINTNPRITLQRNLSRKGPVRGGEKKIAGNENDLNLLAGASPRATSTLLQGISSTLEKPTAIMGPTDNSSTAPQQIQVHHHHQRQISITNNDTASTNETESAARKRFSFRQPSNATWIFDPRRILFFFATLSCIGTILLIYFTLSMGFRTAFTDKSKQH